MMRVTDVKIIDAKDSKSVTVNKGQDNELTIVSAGKRQNSKEYLKILTNLVAVTASDEEYGLDGDVCVYLANFADDEYGMLIKQVENNEPKHYGFAIDSVLSDSSHLKDIAVAIGSMFHKLGVEGKFYIKDFNDGTIGMGFIQPDAYVGEWYNNQDHDTYESNNNLEEDQAETYIV